jgi:hypothetical protein
MPPEEEEACWFYPRLSETATYLDFEKISAVIKGSQAEVDEGRQRSPSHDTQTARSALPYDYLDRPLTRLERPRWAWAYDDRIAFMQIVGTHLFSASKQAPAHVTHKPSIPFLTSVSRIVVSVRQIVITSIVRHCEEAQLPGRCLRRQDV